MTEESKAISTKIRAEANKIDEEARKLAEMERRTPLKLSLLFHRVKDKSLWKYMKTTYSKPEEWAEDIGVARSSFFAYVQARELNKTMPDVEFLKFKSVNNALWFGKLPINQKNETMFTKAQKEKAEDFQNSVQAAQKDEGHAVSDKRVTAKYRMYAGQKSVFEEGLRQWAIKNDLDIDDPGRVMELASTVLIQDAGRGQNVVSRIQKNVSQAAFELAQANHLFGSENKLSADETLKQLQAIFEKAVKLLAEAAGIKLELPPTHDKAVKAQAPQTPSEAQANAEQFLKKGKTPESVLARAVAAGTGESSSPTPATQQASSVAHGGGKAEKVKVSSEQLASMRVQ